MNQQFKKYWGPYFKATIFAILSFCIFLLNLIPLYLIGKKLNSLSFKILSIICGIIFFLGFGSPALNFLGGFYDLLMLSCILLPSILSLVNLKKYFIADTVCRHMEDLNINVASIIPIDLDENVQTIVWATPEVRKVSKRLFGEKGLSVLFEIDRSLTSQLENEKIQSEQQKYDEEEKKRLEREHQLQIEHEKHEFELAKINAEKERAAAMAELQKQQQETLRIQKEKDAKRLEYEHKIQVEREKQQFELDKINAEKQRADAIARLQDTQQVDTTIVSNSNIVSFEQSQSTCKQCGQPLTDGAIFCVYCGNKN